MASVPNRACPICRACDPPHDKTGDHLFLMADGNQWCCNHTQYHPDYMMYFEDIGEESEEPTEPSRPSTLDPEREPTMDDVLTGNVSKVTTRVDPTEFPVQGYRGVSRAIYGNAGVRMELNGDGNPKALYFPLQCLDGSELWKVRVLPKKFFTTEEVGDRQLKFFKQDLVGMPKRLLINEGYEDCLAAEEMLSKWKIPTVSVPNGANLKAFEDNYEWLVQVEELYIDMDHDDAGDKLVKKIVALFPQARVVTHTEKDACDMYKLKGGRDAYIKAFWNAKMYKPDAIVEINEELILKATAPVEWGMSYPFQQLTKKTFGLVPKLVIGIGAGPGEQLPLQIVRSVEEFCEFGEHLRAMAYDNPEPSTTNKICGEGVTTIPRGSRVLVDSKRRTCFRMEIS